MTVTVSIFNVYSEPSDPNALPPSSQFSFDLRASDEPGPTLNDDLEELERDEMVLPCNNLF